MQPVNFCLEESLKTCAVSMRGMQEFVKMANGVLSTRQASWSYLVSMTMSVCSMKEIKHAEQYDGYELVTAFSEGLAVVSKNGPMI